MYSDHSPKQYSRPSHSLVSWLSPTHSSKNDFYALSLLVNGMCVRLTTPTLNYITESTSECMATEHHPKTNLINSNARWSTKSVLHKNMTRSLKNSPCVKSEVIQLRWRVTRPAPLHDEEQLVHWVHSDHCAGQALHNLGQNFLTWGSEQWKSPMPSQLSESTHSFEGAAVVVTACVSTSFGQSSLLHMPCSVRESKWTVVQVLSILTYQCHKDF